MAASRVRILLLVLIAVVLCFQVVAGNTEGEDSEHRSLQVKVTRSPTTRAPSMPKPTKSPSGSRPTKSPTTSRPTKSPTTSRPTLSPTPPTHRPTKSPTTSKPSKSPTTPRPSRSPSTSRPTRSPVLLACETWKNELRCGESLNICQWVTRKACPTPKTPLAKCPSLAYGCRTARAPFCNFRGTVKQKQYQCSADPNCLWNAKKRTCGVNSAVEYTLAPTNEPTTPAPTTLSPTSKSPTSKTPTVAPSTKRPTSKSPTTARPTTPTTSQPTVAVIPTARPTKTTAPTKRGATARPTPTAGTASCYDGCWLAGNGICEDGLEGSVSPFGPCYQGSDCTDCGPRPWLDL